jgi:phage/plasmid-like protein (TIGR03299 family)
MPAGNITGIAYNQLEGTPWHGLGKPIQGGMTWAEACKAADLDWEVRLEDIYTKTGEVIPGGYRRIYRSDNNATFGVVGNEFTPVQNNDAFRFFDEVIGAGHALFDVAGQFDGGKRIWLLVRFPEGTFDAVRGDTVHDYLLFTHGHDGRHALQGGNTPIRVVCMNTLNAALGQGLQFGFKHHHTRTVSEKMTSSARLLSEHLNFLKGWQEQVAAMVSNAFDADETERFFLDVIQFTGSSKTKAEKYATTVADLATKRQREPVEKMLELVETGKGSDIVGVRGTGWGLYNAVTEFVDHYGVDMLQGRASDRGRDDRQFAYMLEGRGAQMKSRALELATGEAQPFWLA